MKQALGTSTNILVSTLLYVYAVPAHGQIAEGSELRFVKSVMVSRIPNPPKAIPSGDKGQIATVQPTFRTWRGGIFGFTCGHIVI